VLRTWRRLSSLLVYGTFQSRVPVLELVTGKSQETADKNVCATTLCVGCTRINFGFWDKPCPFTILLSSICFPLRPLSRFLILHF
jgi:hypothetical protein